MKKNFNSVNGKPQSRLNVNHFTHLTHLTHSTHLSKRFAFTLAEGATHVAMQHNTRKLAFTLAEVLVTLAVIGIVAVMTIPNLVQSYQSRAWDTASSTFNRKLGEALRIMNTQEILAGYGSTEDFVEALSKHLKITKTCTSSNLTACFNNKVMWGENEVDVSELSTSADMDNHKDWGTNIVGFQMANGVTGLVAYNPACTQDPYDIRHINISGTADGKKGGVAFPGTDCIAMVYDVTGYGKPNTSTKDIRGNITTLAKSRECIAEINGRCWGVPFAPAPVSKTECEEMKASGKYGTINLCDYDNDYWLGAAKQCGGIDNLPSADDMLALKKQLYNNASNEFYQDDARDMSYKDPELFAKFRNTSIGHSFFGFALWAKETYGYEKYGDVEWAFMYYFYDYFPESGAATECDYYDRDEDDALGVCVY